MNCNFKGSYQHCFSPGTLLKTSGSMGVPKNIYHSFDQHQAASRAVIKNSQLDSDSRSLLSLPLNHMGGLAILMRANFSGGSYIEAPKKWTLEWAVDQKITHISLVSTQLIRFFREPDNFKFLRKFKAITLGGSMMPKNLIKKAYQEDLNIITTYGSTETASQISATKLGDSLDKLLTSGRILEDRKIKIASDKEIYVRGFMLCGENSSYYKTGDLGELTLNGYLSILGRKDNQLISGGENIYPEEIERALLEHPNINQVIVSAKHDSEFGQRPVAFILLNNFSDFRPESFQDFLRDRLDKFKIPKDFRPWPSDLIKQNLKSNRAYFSELAKSADK